VFRQQHDFPTQIRAVERADVEQRFEGQRGIGLLRQLVELLLAGKGFRRLAHPLITSPRDDPGWCFRWDDTAGPASRRYGYELNVTYQALRWLESYGTFSEDHSRFKTPCPLSSDNAVKGSGYHEWNSDVRYAFSGGWRRGRACSPARADLVPSHLGEEVLEQVAAPQRAVVPPSTVIFVPVTQLASSDAK